MKQLSLITLSLLFTMQMAFGQSSFVQINPYAGWTTSSALQLYYGKARTTDGFNFGGNISFGKGITGAGFSKNAFLELQYNYLKTQLQYRTYTGNVPDQDLGDIAMHNIMIGGTKGSGNGTVEGYGGTYVGVTIFDPSNNLYSTRTKFTLSFGAGLKYAVSPAVGLRLHAQMYMPVWGSDFYLGWSPGGGTSTGIMATAVNVYANFNLGLYFTLGQH